MQQLKSDLRRSGHDPVKLDNLEPKVMERLFNTSTTSGEEAVPKTSIVFPVHCSVFLRVTPTQINP